MAPKRTFVPPTHVGEPYRGDPKDPPPFITESERAATAAPTPAWTPTTGPPYGHPPSHSPEYSGDQAQPSARPRAAAPADDRPIFIPTSKTRAITPEKRFANIALWLGVASIAVGPLIGLVAIGMGAMSIERGQKKLGWLAIIFGLIGTALGILVAVLVARGVLPSFQEMLDDIRTQNKK